MEIDINQVSLIQWHTSVLKYEKKMHLNIIVIQKLRNYIKMKSNYIVSDRKNNESFKYYINQI